MRLGVLYPNKTRYPIEAAIPRAIQMFEKAKHTQGHAPAEVHVHPSSLPDVRIIAGLPVQSDERIQPWQVRVTTADEQNEVQV